MAELEKLMSQIKQRLAKILKIANREISVESKEISLRARKSKGDRLNIVDQNVHSGFSVRCVTKNLSEPLIN